MVGAFFTHVKVKCRQPFHTSLPFSPIGSSESLHQRGRKAREFCYYNKYNEFNSELYLINRAATAIPKFVQLFLVMFYFCSSKRILHFQFTGGNSPFWNLENVLFPKGSCESSTESGLIVFYLPMLYFFVRKRILDSQFTDRNSPFWHLEIVRLDGTDGNQKSQLNFFVFKSISYS